jgi:BASS family bile acid:Na+ symporter
VLVALEISARLAVFAFVISSMLGVGSGLTLSQILEPFRSPRLVLSSLAANFVLVPLLAFVLTKTIAVDRSLTIGVLLLGTGAGAPFLPKLAEFARGKVAFAVALMVLLMTATIVYMPIVLPILLPASHVSPWMVAKPLLTVMLVPLALGLWLRARRGALAGRMEPHLRRASTIALVLAIILVSAVNYPKIEQTLSFNTILVCALLSIASFACGFALGGPSQDARRIVALGTAQRDISAALLVAVETFRDSGVVVMLIAMALVGLCLQVPIAIAFGRHVGREGAPGTEKLAL